MQIYKIVLILTLLAGIGNNALASASLEEFVNSRGGSQQQASLANPGSIYKGCFASENHLICLDCRNYPGLAGNLIARQAILQGLNLIVKSMVCNYAADQNRAENFRDQTAVKEVINELQPLGRIEFLSASEGNWAGAVAAIKRTTAKKELTEIYKAPAFKDAYGRLSLPAARDYMQTGEFKKALVILKELHDLKYANVEAYILAGEAFSASGDKIEALKLAKEVWETLRGQLDAHWAEQLGDLFKQLGDEDNAVAAYSLASEKLLGNESR